MIKGKNINKIKESTQVKNKLKKTFNFSKTLNRSFNIKKKNINKNIVNKKDLKRSLLTNIRKKEKIKKYNSFLFKGYSGWFLFYNLHYEMKIIKALEKLEEDEDLPKEEYIRIWHEVLKEHILPDLYTNAVECKQSYTIKENTLEDSKAFFNVLKGKDKWDYKWKVEKYSGKLAQNLHINAMFKKTLEIEKQKVTKQSQFNTKIFKLTNSFFNFFLLKNYYNICSKDLLKTNLKREKQVFFFFLKS